MEGEGEEALAEAEADLLEQDPKACVEPEVTQRIDDCKTKYQEAVVNQGICL